MHRSVSGAAQQPWLLIIATSSRLKRWFWLRALDPHSIIRIFNILGAIPMRLHVFIIALQKKGQRRSNGHIISFSEHAKLENTDSRHKRGPKTTKEESEKSVLRVSEITSDLW